MKLNCQWMVQFSFVCKLVKLFPFIEKIMYNIVKQIYDNQMELENV